MLTLRLLLRGRDRETILGDLAESHALRASREGRWRAALWYWQQVATVPIWLAAARAWDGARGGRSDMGNVMGSAVGSAMGGFVRDLGTAVRSALARPGFSLVVIGTLGLAVAANTAMFSVVNLAVFQSLPYPDADRLVVGRTLWPGGSVGMTVSAPDFYDVRSEATAFESISALTPFPVETTLTGGDGAERVQIGWASPGLFHTLGVQPALGREFRPEEGEPGGSFVVMVTHGLWQRRWGGSRALLGSTITAEGMPATVVGILPPGFTFVNGAELWLPMVRDGAYAGARQFHNWLVVGRLRPDATLESARTEVDGIMGRLAREYPASNRDKGMVLAGLQDALTENLSSTLALMGAAGLLLLLLAAGNVANLLLARGSVRETELAVRTSLGAGRGRLVRMLLTENLVLALVAGAAGTALAVALQRTLVSATPLVRVGIDAGRIRPEVLAFGLGLSLVAVLLSGVAPALAVSGSGLAERLRSGSHAAITRGRTRFRSGLVVLQVALSMMILMGAGLLTRSFVELRGVEPGFDPEGLLTAVIGLPRGRYEDPADRRLFYDALLERARAMPGARGAALVSHLPFRDGGGNVAAWNPDSPPVDASEARLAHVRVLSPGYFETMDIPLVSGRRIRPEDRVGTPPVVVVNQRLAATLFPDGSPVGRYLALDEGSSAPALEIVGVVGDVRLEGLEDDAPMTAYLSLGQRTPTGMRLVVRVPGDPPALVAPLRETLRSLDPDVPLAQPRTMEEILAGSLSFTRQVTGALGLFAGVALFLAALGLYGVLAYQVAQRQREIGVRLALGAARGAVVRQVVRGGLTLVALGMAAGLLAAVAAVGLVEDMLFGVAPTDLVTVLASSTFLGLVGLVACVLPAWRAGRVDPVVAFRGD